MQPHTPSQGKSTALTCDCVTSKSPIIVETPLALHTNPSSRNMHCPLCSQHPSAVQTTDVFHIRAVYADLSYNAVKIGLNTLDNYLTSHPHHRHKYPSPQSKSFQPKPRSAWADVEYHIPNPVTDRIAFEAYLMDAAKPTAYTSAPTNPVSNGVCYVNGHCTTCGASFTITRNTTSDKRPTDPEQGLALDDAHPCGYTYCPFCGSETLVITPTSTDETAWQVLSRTYNIPVPALQVLYDIWQKDSLFTANHTFASFLNQFADKANEQIADRRNTTK